MATATKKEKAENVDGILKDINKKFVYVLAVKNPPRGRVFDPETNMLVNEREYPISKNILFRSSIVWKGGLDPFSKKERPAGKYYIQYYDGCTTLFVDDQPKEKETIDNLISSTRDCSFNNGFFDVMGYDSLKKTFMDWASYNLDSPYRIQSIDPIWKSANIENQLIEESKLMDVEDEARDLAKKATFSKMKIHAGYLGISLVDTITNEDLSESALRAEYRKVAKNNPSKFIESFNDNKLEIKNWIADAISKGTITASLVPNKITWQSGAVICETDGLKNTQLIIDKIAEFSSLDEGADFITQLRSIYG